MRLILFLLLALLTGCLGGTSRGGENTSGEEVHIEVDTAAIAILDYDMRRDLWLFGHSMPAPLSSEELQQIELTLRQCIDDYNLGQQQAGTVNRIEIDNYKRQYIAVVTPDGRKEVWVNCFCGEHPDWRESIVYVLDGGPCYFNLKINLKTGRYFKFSVNGEA